MADCSAHACTTKRLYGCVCARGGGDHQITSDLLADAIVCPLSLPFALFFSHTLSLVDEYGATKGGNQSSMAQLAGAMCVCVCVSMGQKEAGLD